MAVLMVLGLAAAASAHTTASPMKQLAWDQTGTTAPEAQAMTCKIYADGASIGTTLTGVTCSSPGGLTGGSVAFPAFTPGTHTLQLTASNAAGESAKSAVFTFTFVVVPAVPANVRVQ